MTESINLVSADTLRGSDLATLATCLQDRRTRAIDVVVPGKALSVLNGAFLVNGVEPLITDDGVTEANGMYTPTNVALEGLASKLDIPLRYLRRMFETYPDLYDSNVNGWLSRSTDSYLLRGLRGESGTGVARAFLSDTYRVIDNFDVLLATLEGLGEAGEDSPRVTADLTERRMIVRVRSSAVSAAAPALLAGYRSPFTGRPATELPLVWAGFVVSNSEVGSGAFTVTPQIEFEVCTNGMTVKRDAMRKIHLGAELEAGTVRWSDKTIRRNLDLVKSQAADAVRHFLTPEYLAATIASVSEQAATPIVDAPKVIEGVSKKMGYTEGESKTILDHFIRGGQMTAGGVMQAVTSAAQTTDGADRQWEMELSALDAMAFAAVPARR